MKPCALLLGSVLSFGLLTPQSGLACGEGLYTMGQSSRHQGYLAPHSATVLIYNDQATVPESTKAVYRGLVRAGHTVEVARDQGQLATALRDRSYDVVIANYEKLGILEGQAEAVSEAKILPVLDKQRSAKGGQERFRLALSQDASLGQYLKLIDRLVTNRG